MRYIIEFIEFPTQHVFVRGFQVSTRSSKRFKQLNILILYGVYVIKTHECPRIKVGEINEERYRKKINKNLMEVVRVNGTVEEYFLDILRYFQILEIIKEDKYII